MYNTTYNTRPCVQLYNCACCRLQLVATSCRLHTAQPALNCQSAVGTILHHRPSWVRRRTQCGTNFTNLMSRTGPKQRRQFAETAHRSSERQLLVSEAISCLKRASSIGQLNLGFIAPPRKKTKRCTHQQWIQLTFVHCIKQKYYTRIIRIIQPTFQKFIKHSSIPECEVLHCARVFMNLNIQRSQFTREGEFLLLMTKWTSKPSHS